MKGAPVPLRPTKLAYHPDNTMLFPMTPFTVLVPTKLTPLTTAVVPSKL